MEGPIAGSSPAESCPEGLAQAGLDGCGPGLAPLHLFPLRQPQVIHQMATDSLFHLPPAETLMDSTTATAELGWTVHPPSGVSYPVALWEPRAWSGVSLLHVNIGGLVQQKSATEAKCLGHMKRSRGKSTKEDDS